MKAAIVLGVTLAVVMVSCQQRAESECETWRNREQRRKEPLVGGIIPECETNGDFKGLQCHAGRRFCQCWKTDGRPITQASTKIKSCDCIRQKDSATGGPPGSFLPECRENGTFAARQCNPSANQCWCSDLQGNRIGQAVANGNSLNCA